VPHVTPPAPRFPVARRAAGAAALVCALGIAAGWLALRPRSDVAPRPVPAGDPPPAQDAAAVPQRPSPPTGAPNVVVVVTCTLRRDQLTPYGGPGETSPFLQTLAAGGARFDDTIASSSWTKESATAILTGHPALDVGMTDPTPALGRRRIAPDVETLAERLAGAGWWTAGVTANPHLNADFGFAQGMDRYHGTVETGFQKVNKRYAADVVTTALQFLDERKPDEQGRPFYLQLVAIDPHFPIETEPGELDRFLHDDVPVRIARYRAMVRRVDDALARLDQGLTDRGYGADDTVFVVVADHGEGLDLPAHHRSQHGRVLYRSLVQVGWLVRGPGVGAGVVVDGLSSQLDVLPTVLGLAGLPTTPPADELQAGYDWSRLLAAGGQTIRQRAIADTWYEGANRASVWTGTRACQRDFGSVGIERDTFETACFDRLQDPDFTQPISDPVLEAALVQWRTDALARAAAFTGGGDAPREDAVRDQLEALGYAQ
jgi:arylsulfatase A-like enzyme